MAIFDLNVVLLDQIRVYLFMLTLLFDERQYVLPSFGVPLSAKPAFNNIVNLSASSRPFLDIDTLQKAYEAGFKNFFGYAYSLTFTRDTSSDIVQTVFARLVAKVNRTGQVEVENIEAYIIRSIRNEFIDRKKKELKRPSHLAVASEASPSAELDHINGQANEALESAIENLPTAQRTCIVMYYFNEMNVNAIANEIGISASAVKTHIQRARKTLGKSDLRDTEGGDN